MTARRGEKADSEAPAGSPVNLLEMNIQELYNKFRECGSVTTDSRAVKGGEMFFALKGENFDGNEYALKALDAGAAYAVVSESSDAAKCCCPELAQQSAAGSVDSVAVSADGGNPYAGKVIPVPDTLLALQELARYHRSMTFVNGKPLTVIGLTGTNGKTTTKELIKTVLSVKYRVTATEGNLNNSIGVPLTLLKINSETQIAVVEMGASHPGDIKELVSVALPNYGLITNVGRCHLLGFGSFEGVMKTKGELYDYIQRTADKAFLNVDNPDLCKMASERPDLLTIPYGVKYQNVTVHAASDGCPFLKMTVPSPEDGTAVEIVTHLVGAYNADNVMAAIAVGKEFGISLQEAAGAIASYIPSNNRSQLVRTERNTLIVDAYNANPTSVNAALDNFGMLNATDKAVMLGDMLELGDFSEKEHLDIVTRVKNMRVKAFFVGKEFGKALEQSKCGSAAGDSGYAAEGKPDAGVSEAEPLHFNTSDELASWLEANPLDGCMILVKGSRGTRMEKVIPVL